MTNEQTALYAYILFTGNDDFSLDAVTESLGVQPTHTWKVGDRVNTHTPLMRDYTAWKYETETLETLVVEDVLDPLLENFGGKVDIINDLKERLNLNVQIALVITMENGRTPGLVIWPAFSRFASSINAFIDIDMYVGAFSEDEEE